MEFQLTIITGDQRGQNIVICEGQKILIGRGENCDFRLTSNGVSRKHCYIVYHNDIISIEDAGSSNGTYVNDAKLLNKKELVSGDIIRICLVKMQLRSQSLTTESAPEKECAGQNVTHRKDKKEPTLNLSQTITMERDLMLLHKVVKLSQQASPNLKNLLGRILETVVAGFRVERGCIILKPRLKKGSLSYIYRIHNTHSTGYRSDKFSVDDSIIQNAIVRGEGIASSATQEHCLKTQDEDSMCSIMCATLKKDSEILGAIYLESDTNSFKKSALDLLAAIGSQLGTAIVRSFAEKKLLAAEQHYRTLYSSLIDNCQDVIYQRQLDSSFLVVSRAIEDLLGFPANMFMENSNFWEDCVYEDDRANVRQQFAKTLQGEKVVHTLRMVDKNGHGIWVEETCYPITSKDGEVICVQGTLRDITEMKLLQQELEQIKNFGIHVGSVARKLDYVLNQIDERNGESKEQALTMLNELSALVQNTFYRMGFLDFNNLLATYLESSEFASLNQMYPQVKIHVDLAQESLIVKASSAHLNNVIDNIIGGMLQKISVAGIMNIKTDRVYLDKMVLHDEKMSEGEYVMLRVQQSGNVDDNPEKTTGNTSCDFDLETVSEIMIAHGGYVHKEYASNSISLTLYLVFERRAAQKLARQIE